MTKRLTAFLIAVSLIFTALPVWADSDTIDYAALGDSIARGYGLPDPSGGSYPARFAADHDLGFVNYGIDGLTAKELLAALQSDQTASGPAIVDDLTLSGASVITVSIGSNELLQYIIGMIAEEFGVDPSSPDVNTELTEKIRYVLEYESSNTLLIHVSNIQAALENNEELYAICDELKNDTIPAIAAEIRKRNPNAQLIFTNIYNPYKNMNMIYPLTDTMTVSRNIGGYFQPYIDRVNSGLTSTDTYTVADIAAVFTKPGFVNASLDMRSMSTFSFDPHPTRAGHNAIKNVLNTVYIPKVDDPYVPVDHIYGDVNYDGTVTAADSAMVLQYTLNKSIYLDAEALIRADVTGEGEITSADSAAILQKALVASFIFNAET